MELNEKQIQILETAEQLFSAHGFEGTSVRDIAQEAGVNVAMISYYFGSKEKLLEAMFIHRIAASRITLENLIQDTTLTPMQKIESLIDSFVDKMTRNADFHRIIMREQLTNSGKGFSALIYENKQRNLQLVTKLIQEGQRKKQFTKKVDIPLLMATMIGTFNQLISTLGYHRMVNKMEDMADEEFQKYIIKKLKTHLKITFKALLTYEEQ